MRLFNLVKQDHGIGSATHCLGQLTALAISHIARGRPDKTRDVVLLAVFAHVEPYQSALFVEKPARQLLGQKRLPDPRRADKEKDADGAVALLQPRARSKDGLRKSLDRLLLSDNAPGKVFVESLEPFRLVARDTLQRDARQLGHEPFYLAHAYLGRLVEGGTLP